MRAKQWITGGLLAALSAGWLVAQGTDQPHSLKFDDGAVPTIDFTGTGRIQVYSAQKKGLIMTEKVQKTDEEWKKVLSPQQFDVLRKKGTEPPFTNEYANNHEKGIYKCRACGNDLFDSATKFESGTGWPSFWQPIDAHNVEKQDDDSHFTHRTEVVCSRCGSHLGHLFEDGPKPTGLRYCMNSASLRFDKAK